MTFQSISTSLAVAEAAKTESPTRDLSPAYMVVAGKKVCVCVYVLYPRGDVTMTLYLEKQTKSKSPIHTHTTTIKSRSDQL